MKINAMLFISGILIGGFFMLMFSVWSISAGKSECEKELPRTQFCVKKWVKP